jgi:drug/metabolite transporter (DMT)-like permease
MKKIALTLILLAGILWGSMGLFVRKLNTIGMTSMEIVALRALVTTITMFLYLLLFERKMLKIRLRDIWCFLGTGICSIVFFNVCYFKAITITSLSVAAVLLYTAPAIVMVLSYFLFGEKMTKRKVTALFMTLLGCALVTGVFSDWGNVSGLGILTGLGAGLGYALYSIFSRYALERGYHSLTITFYTFLVATIFSFAIGNGSKAAVAATSSFSMLAFSCAFGVLCTVVPYLAYTAGLKYVENSKASIFASIEPVTATILGIVVFHESVSLWEMLGMALVIGALVVCNGERSRG